MKLTADIELKIIFNSLSLLSWLANLYEVEGNWTVTEKPVQWKQPMIYASTKLRWKDAGRT